MGGTMVRVVTESANEQLSLGFAEQPRRLFRATPTRLTTWMDCPRRYRFTYLERPTPPKGAPWAHNSMGAAVHTALATWWRLPVERRTPEEASGLLYRGWLSDGFRDQRQSDQWRTHATKMVEDYVATLDPGDEPIGVERTVGLTTKTLALSGRIDRLDERPMREREPGEDRPVDDRPELVVVDYKTGRRTLTTADARSSLALAVYAAAAARTMRRPCTTVELHHLPTGTIVSWDHTEDGLRRHLQRAESIGEDASAAEGLYKQGQSTGLEMSAGRLDELFPPQPGTLCQWCDFAGVCPEGRQAYPPRRSWEGLDTAVGEATSPSPDGDGSEDIG